MADISFDEVKNALKLPDGRTWDETKLKDAIEAAINNNQSGKLEEIVNSIKVEELSIESKDDSANVDDKAKATENKGMTISEGGNESSENSNENTDTNTDSQQPVDENWKEDYKNEWRQWATDNNKEFLDVNVPGSTNDVCIRLFDNKDKKKDGEYAAEISYKGPHNVTLKGNNGKAPDNQYFEQTVKMAMAKNGPDIEFGQIQSNEFKAKLLAACYINGANPLNAPTEEEMASWPKELQDMVNDAKAKAPKETEAEKTNNPKTTEQDKTPQFKLSPYAQAWSDVIDHKMDKPSEELDLAAYQSLEDKATYLAAAKMAGIKVKNAPTEEELKGVKNPETLAALNDAKELDAAREKIKEHKTKSPDEKMDITMFNKGTQTYYNIAALEAGVKLETSLEESDLGKQPPHLEKALRRQRNEAKIAAIKASKAREKGVDEKTFEQGRNADRQIRIQDWKNKQAER